MRREALLLDLLDGEGLERPPGRQGLLEVQPQFALVVALVIAQRLQADGEAEGVVLDVEIGVVVDQQVDPELAARHRGLVGAGAGQIQTAGVGEKVRANQDVAGRIGADAIAVARAVVDEHRRAEGQLQRLAVGFAGHLQPRAGGPAPVGIDVRPQRRDPGDP